MPWDFKFQLEYQSSLFHFIIYMCLCVFVCVCVYILLPAGHLIWNKTVQTKFSQGQICTLTCLFSVVDYPAKRKLRKTPLVCCCDWMTLGLFVAVKLWNNVLLKLGTLILETQSFFTPFNNRLRLSRDLNIHCCQMSCLSSLLKDYTCSILLSHFSTRRLH